MKPEEDGRATEEEMSPQQSQDREKRLRSVPLTLKVTLQERFAYDEDIVLKAGEKSLFHFKRHGHTLWILAYHQARKNTGNGKMSFEKQGEMIVQSNEEIALGRAHEPANGTEDLELSNRHFTVTIADGIIEVLLHGRNGGELIFRKRKMASIEGKIRSSAHAVIEQKRPVSKMEILRKIISSLGRRREFDPENSIPIPLNITDLNGTKIKPAQSINEIFATRIGQFKTADGHVVRVYEIVDGSLFYCKI